MRAIHFSILLLTLLVCARTQAQSRPLSWEDCLKLASENNPALRSAQAAVTAAEDQALASRSGYMPQISGSLNYNSGNALTLSGGSGVVLGGAQSQNSGTFTASLTANENLFNGLSDLAKVEQARAGLQSAEAALRTAKAQLSYSLKTAFVGVDVAQKSVILADQIISRRETNLGLVELRFRDGQENKGSVLLYQAYLKDAHYGKTQSADNVVEAKAQLAQALGLDAFDDLEIVGSVPTHEPSARPDFKKLVLQTPVYLQAEAQENSTSAGIVLARSQFFPTLGVSTNANVSGPWVPQNDYWSVGVNISIPIFNGGKDYFGTKAAIENHHSAELTLNDVTHSSRFTVENSYLNYIESVEKLQVDSSYLDAARVRAEIARADYNNGLASFQDWDLAETDLITREKNILTSTQSRVTSEAAWEQAQGQGALP